jgi:hypothetical protein
MFGDMLSRSAFAILVMTVVVSAILLAIWFYFHGSAKPPTDGES